MMVYNAIPKFKERYLDSKEIPAWECKFCGSVNMPNDPIVVCHTCRKIGCPQCTTLISNHFEHLEME